MKHDRYNNEKGSNISTHYDEGENKDGIAYVSTHYNENTDGVKYSNVHYTDGTVKGERWDKDRYANGKFTDDEPDLSK